MLQRIYVTLFLCFSTLALFASFPVNQEKSTQKENVQIETVAVNDVDLGISVPDTDAAISPAVAKGGADDELIITLLLWFFLGGLAAHRWYARKPAGWNILFIITLGGLGIWWIIDLINILTDNW